IQAPIQLELREEAQKARLLPLHRRAPAEFGPREIDPGLLRQLDEGPGPDAAFEMTMKLDLGELLEVHGAYLPVNLAGRFSRKAVVPSFMSDVDAICPKRSASIRRPSARGTSRPRCTASRV